MELAIIIGVAIVVLLIGFIGVPWLQKKGYLTKASNDTAEQIVQLIGLVLQNIDFENDKTKNQIDTVFGICQKVVQYVEQISVNDNGEVKKALAVKLTIGVLEKLNFELTDANKSLIEIGIEAAVNQLIKN
jgi:hypothetical protein